MINIAVSISQASGSKFKPNKYGKLPFVLSPLNGILPENSGIIDATVAERMGLTSGSQAVLSISPRPDYIAPNGTVYKNYNYALVARLGNKYQDLVAEQVVASMNFGFTSPSVTPTPTPTPVEEEFTPTPEPVDAA